MNRMIANAVALFNVTIIILCFVSCATGKETLTRFPGEVSELFSPDKRHVLCNIDSDIFPYHTLYLKDLENNTKEKILSYNRWVDILWSPNGTGLLINDHGGSDYTNSLLLFFDGVKKQIDLKEILLQKMGDNRSIFGNHHVYIECVEWLSENRVKIKITGYGEIDPKGFSLLYEYTIGEGFKLIPTNK